MEKYVLVVDDEDSFREMVVEYLESLGYKALQACHGEEAVDGINLNKVGVAIVDVRMPVMNGLKLLREIKKIRNDFPVILITGFELPKETIATLPYQADDYITKPFSLERLNILLEKYMGN